MTFLTASNQTPHFLKDLLVQAQLGYQLQDIFFWPLVFFKKLGMAGFQRSFQFWRELSFVETVNVV